MTYIDEDEDPISVNSRFRDAVLDMLEGEHRKKIRAVRAEIERHGEFEIHKERSMPGLDMVDFLLHHRGHDGMPATFHAQRLSAFLRQSYALHDVVGDASCSGFEHNTPGAHARYVLRVYWTGSGPRPTSLTSEYTSCLFVDIRKWEFIDAPVKLSNSYVGISGRTSHTPAPNIVRIDFIPNMS